MSQVATLLKLVLVMPATNAVSERSFSAMRIVKDDLRSCMSEDRFNHLMLLHVHKHRTDALDMVKVANRFTAAAFGRDTFGSFSALDMVKVANRFTAAAFGRDTFGSFSALDMVKVANRFTAAAFGRDTFGSFSALDMVKVANRFTAAAFGRDTFGSFSALDMVKVANRFTAAAFGRDTFGSFSPLDLSRASVLQKSQSTQTRTDSACVKSDKCEAGKSSM